MYFRLPTFQGHYYLLFISGLEKDIFTCVALLYNVLFLVLCLVMVVITERNLFSYCTLMHMSAVLFRHIRKLL